MKRFTPPLLGILWSPLFIIRRSLLKEIKKNILFVKGKTLDFGCGTKPYQKLFANSKQYIGLDVKTSINSHNHGQVDIFYDGNKIPFDNETFDSVVSFEVIEHLFDPANLLQEIYRVLKKNSYFVLTIPFCWEEHEEPFDYARYTSYGIAFVLQKCKFKIIKISKTTTTIEAILSLLAFYFARSLSNNLISKIISRLFLVGPINIIAVLLSTILPYDDKLFCNQVIVCQKK